MAKQTQTNFFPFYGAGEARYYEWAEVIIRFEKKPTPDQIKKIIKLAPKPIKPQKDDFNRKMLLAGGGQFINRDIHKKYDNGNIPQVIIADFGDKKTAEIFYSSTKAINAFNNHIEKWLLEIHGFCTIQFAYRMEDGEAGGTKLSDWHTKSIKETKKLLEKLEKNKDTFKQTEDEKNSFKYTLKGIIAFSKIKIEQIPTKLVNYIFPAYQLSNLFKKGEIKDCVKIINKNIKDKNFIDEILYYLIDIKIEDKKERTKFLALAKEILQSKNNSLKEDGAIIRQIVKASILDNDKKLINLLKKQLSNKKRSAIYINYLGFEAYQYIKQIPQAEKKNKKEIKLTIDLFQFALNIEVKNTTSLDLSTYGNALWILENDNTGLPVNKKLNKQFLEKCLPFGPKNPGIYFNAACLYAEMSDVENVIECIQLAKKYNYDQYDYMINEIKTHKTFASFRKYARIQKLIS